MVLHYLLITVLGGEENRQNRKRKFSALGVASRGQDFAFTQEVTVESAEEMKALLSMCRKAVDVHRLPPAGLGVLHAGLLHTTHAYAHALRLESFDWKCVQGLVQQIFSSCTDRGVESTVRTGV